MPSSAKDSNTSGPWKHYLVQSLSWIAFRFPDTEFKTKEVLAKKKDQKQRERKTLQTEFAVLPAQWSLRIQPLYKNLSHLCHETLGCHFTLNFFFMPKWYCHFFWIQVEAFGRPKGREDSRVCTCERKKTSSRRVTGWHRRKCSAELLFE